MLMFAVGCIISACVSSLRPFLIQSDVTKNDLLAEVLSKFSQEPEKYDPRNTDQRSTILILIIFVMRSQLAVFYYFIYHYKYEFKH